MLSSLWDTARRVFPESRPRYRLVGGLVYAVPLDYWRQGGPSDGTSLREGLPLARIPLLIESDSEARIVRVPVIGGNSVFGIMKNSITEYMFEYYRSNKPEKLKLIYFERPESVVMAALFRMRMPFVGIKRPTRELYDSVWANFVFRAWGVGFSPWAPQKPFTATSMIPVVFSGPARIEVARRIGEILGVHIDYKPVPIGDEAEAIETIIKLRHPLTSDYPRAGVAPAPDSDISKFLKESGFLREERKRREEDNRGGRKEEWTFLEPVPVKMYVAPANTPLVSIIVQKLAMKLFDDMELATIAHAIRSLCFVGPKENTFKIIAGMVFKDVFDGKMIVFKKASSGCGANEEETDELVDYAKMFQEWVAEADYPEYIHELGRAIIEAVRRENAGPRRG